MEDSKTYRTGIIEKDDGNLVFFEQGFDFHFMLSDYRPFSSDNSHTLEATNSGFVYGTTHDNYSIAIFIGDTNKPVYGKQTVQTYMYLLTPGNMMPYPRNREILYDGIVFTGKTLKRVFYPHAFVSHPTEEGQIVSYQDDTMVYHFEVDGVQYTLRVNSDATQGTRNYGIYMINENVRLQLTFSEQQTAADIKKHYDCICTLLSFMTFRSRIDFEKVSLLKYNPQYPGNYEREWDLYIKTPPESCEKTQIDCLTFDDLEDSVQNLLKIIYSCRERQPSYSLDFIPETDEDVFLVDGNSIKATCSGLECEMNFCEIQQSEESERIHVLANQVKELIRQHRASPSPLKEKSYNKIFSDIRHWGMATADNIITLYHQHQMAMAIICSRIGAEVTDDDIENFIKYRNDITHGSYRVNNLRISQTSYVLECLVYCCLLARIGISEAKIEELCRDKVGR